MFTVTFFGTTQPVNVDLTTSTVQDTAKLLHDTWYTACGLGAVK
jgi:hypothetical protein